jgi:hypothetical protein
MAQIKEEINVTNFLLVCLLALIGVGYQNMIKTDERLVAVLEKHETRISQLEKEVAVIKEKQNFISEDSKKKLSNCNFKQYLCVNNLSEKKRKNQA